MLKFFVVQCHPQNIFNIELFPNYGTLLYNYRNNVISYYRYRDSTLPRDNRFIVIIAKH